MDIDPNLIVIKRKKRGKMGVSAKIQIRSHRLAKQAFNPKVIYQFATNHWVGAKVHVTRCVDLYSGQILVFTMTLMTVCVLSSV